MTLERELQKILPSEKVKAKLFERIALASDASFYHLIPEAVVEPTSVEEIQALFSFCRKQKKTICFRAAGTSLSGQSVSDGILVHLARNWKKIEFDQNTSFVKVEPGAIGGVVNLRLAKFGRKIGPDPASISTCMMGGILANNASGMCCGVRHNSYNTLRSCKFVLSTGELFDTAKVDAQKDFEQRAPHLSNGLAALRESILNNPSLKQKIEKKYKIKNTIGYALNSFLDFEDTVDIAQHLLIGSEGTLGFIAEATLDTLCEAPHKITAFLLFKDVKTACDSIEILKSTGATAVELMDRASLAAIENTPGLPLSLHSLPKHTTALLVEFETHSKEALVGIKFQVEAQLSKLPLIEMPVIAKNAKERNALWKTRKGLFPSVGATRKIGTTVLIEDVAVPLESLAEAVESLQKVFQTHRYSDAVIFGHALDGNLHFVVSQSFNTSEDTLRYENMMRDVVHLIAGKFSGSLKAEHGTGRNMSPFVEFEWGRDAYDIMWQVKELFDPDGVLNPGVVLNRDPSAHVKHLKTLPQVNDIVDKCIECGFCEPQCPSRNVTLTPRQRIVVERELARGTFLPSKEQKEIRKNYVYQGIETCAGDGLCATACPVGIDTGKYMRELRGERKSFLENDVSLWFVKHLSFVETLARLGLGLYKFVFGLLPISIRPFFTHAFRRFVPIPNFSPFLPSLTSRQLKENSSARSPDFVYFSTCLSRNLLSSGQTQSTPQLFSEVAKRANLTFIPLIESGLCCGMPFGSKGYVSAHAETLAKLVEKLWTLSKHGTLPIVLDTSSCTFSLRTSQHVLPKEMYERYAQLRFIDAIEFLNDQVLPKLKISKINKSAMLHPVCAVRKMDLEEKLLNIGQICASSASFPEDHGCCGFAGDKGFHFPELTAAATRDEATAIQKAGCDAHYSSNPMCEFALAQASGKPFQSIISLVEESSRS